MKISAMGRRPVGASAVDAASGAVAAEHRIAEAWVGTDLALGFYQRCGWILQETFTRSTGQHMDVLHKTLL
jgi:hypothetical protein